MNPGVRSPIHMPLALALLSTLFFISAQQLGGQAGQTFSSDSHASSPFRFQLPGNLPREFPMQGGLVTSSAQNSQANLDLTVHEWGTFTSIAGNDGQALDWLPLTGSTDLPGFVEHLREPDFKGGLRGTVRMETPVLYFYSPQETSVSVKVSFAKGLITEWYPHASSVAVSNPRTDFSLYQKRSVSGIAWNSVHIEPASPVNFLRDNTENHYYAARETTAAPIRVPTPSGDQQERFLFYRGVSAFTPPISATQTGNGIVLVRQGTASAPEVHAADEQNTPATIPDVILFERRGDKVGYTILGPLQNQAALAPPPLDGSAEVLIRHLESMLISQGLYADEAHAMLETWKSSWFEEGSRLFYLVPRPFVDSVLPLSISPAPAETTRIFVGRLELITPATEQAVESALASGDRTTLAKYCRFLEPILVTMIQNAHDPAKYQRLQNYPESIYDSWCAKR
jgi:hypothetical protein